MRTTMTIFVLLTVLWIPSTAGAMVAFEPSEGQTTAIIPDKTPEQDDVQAPKGAKRNNGRLIIRTGPTTPTAKPKDGIKTPAGGSKAP